MDFSQSLQSKIKARLTSASSVIATGDILRMQAFDKIEPVHAAVTEMVQRLAINPIFSAGFSDHPEVDFKWNVINPSVCRLVISGPVGMLSIIVSHRPAMLRLPARTALKLAITPNWALGKSLGCGSAYGSATPVDGNVDDLSGFLVDCEDMVAEFLADVVTTSDPEQYLPGAF